MLRDKRALICRDMGGTNLPDVLDKSRERRESYHIGKPSRIADGIPVQFGFSGRPAIASHFGLSAIMSFRLARALPAFCLAIVFAAGPALAQNDPNQGDKAKQQQGDQKKEAPRVNELLEVSKQLSGPAGNPECVWVGRNIVGRLYANDLDTAFRHLDLYDRFGCPGGHVQAAFRCVLKQTPAEPQKQENVNARVHSCWVNPAAPAAAATAATPPATTSPGTTTQ